MLKTKGKKMRIGNAQTKPYTLQSQSTKTQPATNSKNTNTQDKITINSKEPVAFGRRIPYRKVSNYVLRGRRLRTSTLRQARKNEGLKTTLNLELQPKKIAKQWFRNLFAGTKMISVPINQEKAIPQETIEKCVSIIEASEKKGNTILVHCQRGKHRTGAIIAAYEGKKNGWKHEDELMNHLEINGFCETGINGYQKGPDLKGIFNSVSTFLNLEKAKQHPLGPKAVR